MVCLSLPWCMKYSIQPKYASCQYYERLDGFAKGWKGWSTKIPRIYDTNISNPIPVNDWLAPKTQLPKTWSCAPGDCKASTTPKVIRRYAHQQVPCQYLKQSIAN